MGAGGLPTNESLTAYSSLPAPRSFSPQLINSAQTLIFKSVSLPQPRTSGQTKSSRSIEDLSFQLLTWQPNRHWGNVEPPDTKKGRKGNIVSALLTHWIIVSKKRIFNLFCSVPKKGVQDQATHSPCQWQHPLSYSTSPLKILVSSFGSWPFSVWTETLLGGKKRQAHFISLLSMTILSMIIFS